MTLPAQAQITGLVLAGGRGSRLGGVDKGLQMLHGQPLAQHALQRLRPQVGPLMVSANRNLDAYRALGVPVWPDVQTDHPGPLAGMLAGLRHCETPWLACVPCDSPHFPTDLVSRLTQAATAAGADIAMAATRMDAELRHQPVFCLMRRELHADLAEYLAAGERKVERWAARHRAEWVVFDDATAFFNANTPDELQQLRGQ